MAEKIIRLFGFHDSLKNRILSRKIPRYPANMRKLVVLICIFLIISGLLLSFPEWNLWFEHEELLVLFHIWLGLFFMVIFPMYAWDHIRTHRHRLKSLTPVSFTGGSQLMAGIGLILSGLILLLYSSGGLRLASDIHEILTYVLILTLIFHSRSSRN